MKYLVASSTLAVSFSGENTEKYQKVVVKWSQKLGGVDKISEEMFKKWGSDLREALGDDVTSALLTSTLNQWKNSGLNLPSEEVLQLFAKIAAKGALSVDTKDLLLRLRDSANAVTAAILPLVTLIKRGGLAVSQIFDMAQDIFNRTIGRFFQRTDQLTKKRRWTTSGEPTSRHRRLNFVEKNENEMYHVNGNAIYGPRPPGGSPDEWSNCSCGLQFLAPGGEWVG